MHLKKKHKIGEILVAILILKLEEKLPFWHIMLYYFKKGKSNRNTKIDLHSVWRRFCG